MVFTVRALSLILYIMLDIIFVLYVEKQTSKSRAKFYTCSNFKYTIFNA